MTTKDGQLTWAAKRAKGMANSVEANERRRRREPPVIDRDQRFANLLDILLLEILDGTCPADGHMASEG